MQKLTPSFKNHLRNLDKLRQALKSPKSWNLMGYFCPKINLSKNIFLQLKHSIQRIQFSATCVKVHQITYVIISFFTTQLRCIFLAQTLHTFYKSSPLKCKFLDFLLLGLKFTKFLMSFFKQKVSFSSKFGSLFSVMRDNSSVLF